MDAPAGSPLGEPEASPIHAQGTLICLWTRAPVCDSNSPLSQKRLQAISQGRGAGLSKQCQKIPRGGKQGLHGVEGRAPCSTIPKPESSEPLPALGPEGSLLPSSPRCSIFHSCPCLAMRSLHSEGVGCCQPEQPNTPLWMSRLIPGPRADLH